MNTNYPKKIQKRIGATNNALDSIVAISEAVNQSLDIDQIF